ncbi:hypothetical protein NC651_029277 [Populus alba x Populus x berolinensis]|nr:hypothetical protein NC651_029277 [Populus alba x Populus x berolinensis]
MVCSKKRTNSRFFAMLRLLLSSFLAMASFLSLVALSKLILLPTFSFIYIPIFLSCFLAVVCFKIHSPNFSTYDIEKEGGRFG